MLDLEVLLEELDLDGTNEGQVGIEEQVFPPKQSERALPPVASQLSLEARGTSPNRQAHGPYMCWRKKKKGKGKVSPI